MLSKVVLGQRGGISTCEQGSRAKTWRGGANNAAGLRLGGAYANSAAGIPHRGCTGVRLGGMV
eukprot:365759-Chlamydomonas_euryale.AAC.4